MLLEVSPTHKVDVSPVSQRYSTPTVLPLIAQIIRLIAFASDGMSSNCLMDFSLFFQKPARVPCVFLARSQSSEPCFALRKSKGSIRSSRPLSLLQYKIPVMREDNDRVSLSHERNDQGEIGLNKHMTKNEKIFSGRLKQQ